MPHLAGVLPFVANTECELGQLIDFAASLDRNLRTRLNAFQHHGVRGESLAWEKLSRAGVEAAAARLRTAGFPNVATPVVWL